MGSGVTHLSGCALCRTAAWSTGKDRVGGKLGPQEGGCTGGIQGEWRREANLGGHWSEAEAMRGTRLGGGTVRLGRDQA